MSEPLSVAAARIRSLSRRDGSLLVAIDGQSGTGKSTFAAHLAKRLDAIHIDQDDFYAGGTLAVWCGRTSAENAALAIDRARLRAEALEPLLAGLRASWRSFDWDTMAGYSLEPVLAEPAPVILLDGTFSAHPDLADLIDITVLATLPEALRLERLRAREGDELDSPWQAVWHAAETHYFASVRPPATFDLVLSLDDA